MRRALLVLLWGAGCGSPPELARDAAGPDAPPVPDAAAADAPPPDGPPADGPPPAPNLVLLDERITNSVFLEMKYIAPNHCTIVEGCVGGSGLRKLLKFDTVTANLGQADLVVGVPGAGDMWAWSSCHGHYHFDGFATYELLGPGGVVASGHKQAFCLEDTDQLDPEKAGPNYTCFWQGITAGWADKYGSYLDCQWIDVTDLPPGDYTLRIAVNPDRTLPESNHDDNVYEGAVTIE